MTRTEETLIINRILIIMLIMLACATGFAHASGKRIILAGKGVSPAAIVIPAEPLTLSEYMAARDLERYLGRVTGQKFPRITEGQESSQRCCIYVGSAAARKLAIDMKSFADEDWIIRTVGGNVYLTGGVFHGPEYAAYHLLEDYVGVHWWNAYEDFVPNKSALSIPELNLKGRPVFGNRQEPGNGRVGSGDFLGRNRVYRLYHEGPNGRMAYYPEAYGSPFTGGHSMQYLVPQTDFDAHPEWFALIDGKRSRESGGLCLTNPELRKTVVERIKGIHMPETLRLTNLVGAPLLPRIYDLSQNDGASWCQCPACTAIYKSEGSQAGNVIDFANSIAGALHSEYPELTFTTFAYQDSRIPPKSIHPLDYLTVRWCSEPLNMARPITDPSNETGMKQFLTWSKLAKSVGVWLYASAFSYMEPYGGYGVAWDFPVPNEFNFQTDYKFYANNGAKSILQETMEYDLVGNDMQDMKVWLAAKLMEDPYQDFSKLAKTFTDGFYGPAGRYIRDYRTALAAAEARKPSVVGMSASLPEFKYLDLEFLMKAYSILDKAEKAVAKNPVYLSRVRRARNGVDRSILFLWPGLVREWVLAGHTPETMPFKREVCIDRYKKMAEARYIQCSVGPEENADGLDVKPAKLLLAKQLKFWESNIYIPAPLSAKFAGVPKDLIYDYPAGNASFRLSENGPAQVVKDSEASGGWAVKVTLKDSDLPLVCGIRTPYGNSAPFESIKLSGAGYQWYDIGKTSLGGSSYLHFLEGNDVRVVFREIGACEIWASIKLNSDSSISIERVTLIKPENRILGTLTMPKQWVVFTGMQKTDPVLPIDVLKTIPAEIEVAGRKIKPVTVNAVDGKFNLADIAGAPTEGRPSYAFLKLSVDKDMDVTLGFGADWWLQAWLDGRTICDTTNFGNGSWPPTCKDYTTTVKITKGSHVLAVRHLSGTGSSTLVIGGPDDLRK